MAQSLPTELLIVILAEAAGPNPAMLMCFALVCRDWHDLIIGEPSLWCHIDSDWSTTVPQWHLQLVRSAQAFLRVRIEESDDRDCEYDYKPELYTSIILREVYISRITDLTVLIRSYPADNEYEFRCWEALADGREWPALRSLRVSDPPDRSIAGFDLPLFQLSIHAPALVNVWLDRVSVRSWASLGLGPQTQVVEWAPGDSEQLNADTVAGLYSILARLANLTTLYIDHRSNLVTISGLIDAVIAWDKLTTIHLGIMDVTIQDIQALFRLTLHLVDFFLLFQNDITGSYTACRLFDQRRGRRNKLEKLEIIHKETYMSPYCETKLIELVEDALDLSTLRILSLGHLKIRRDNPLLSRCTALVKIYLIDVVLEPNFIVDLKQCQNLEIISINADWDPDWGTSDSALHALSRLTPLPHLRSARLSMPDDCGFGETAATVYVSQALAQLGRNASNGLSLHVCPFTSTAQIQQLLPHMAVHGIHVSITPGPHFETNRTLLDVCLTGIPASVGVTAARLGQNMITRGFVIDRRCLIALFETLLRWVDHPSQLETVSFHLSSLNRVPLVVQYAMELLKESRFEWCDGKRYCSHGCRRGKVLSRAG